MSAWNRRQTREDTPPAHTGDSQMPSSPRKRGRMKRNRTGNTRVCPAAVTREKTGRFSAVKKEPDKIAHQVTGKTGKTAASHVRSWQSVHCLLLQKRKKSLPSGLHEEQHCQGKKQSCHQNPPFDGTDPRRVSCAVVVADGGLKASPIPKSKAFTTLSTYIMILKDATAIYPPTDRRAA